MKARNKAEQMVLEMVREGKTPKGWAFDVWVDMSLRAEEEGEQ